MERLRCGRGVEEGEREEAKDSAKDAFAHLGVWDDLQSTAKQHNDLERTSTKWPHVQLGRPKAEKGQNHPHLHTTNRVCRPRGPLASRSQPEITSSRINKTRAVRLLGLGQGRVLQRVLPCRRCR